jgi:hypothetical protein
MLPNDDAGALPGVLGLFVIILGVVCVLFVLLLVAGVVVYFVWKPRQAKETATRKTLDAPKGETAFREGAPNTTRPD